MQELGSCGLLPALSAPRVGHGAAALVDGGLLLAGGNNDSSTGFDASVEIYALGSFEPVPVSPMPEPRTATSAVEVCEGTVVVLGGQSGGDEALVYSATDDTWATLALPVEAGQGPWPTPPLAALSGGRSVVVALGVSLIELECDGEGFLSARLRAELPEGLTPAVLIPLSEDVVTAWPASWAQAEIVAVDMTDGSQRAVTSPPGGPRTGWSALRLDASRLAIVAGQLDATSALTGDVEILDVEQDSWELRQGLLDSHERAHAASASLSDGRLVLVGGLGAEGQRVDDAIAIDLVTDEVSGISWSAPRRDVVATAIPALGVVLISGGLDAEGRGVATLEALRP